MLHALFAKIRLRSRYIATVLQWILFALVLGGLCGLLGTAFDLLLELVSHQFGSTPWLILLLPAAGLVIVFLYHRVGKITKDNGPDMIIHSVRDGREVSPVVAPLVFVGTVLTQLCGGSSGREGAAIQMGGSVGIFCGRLFRMQSKNVHMLAMCGMAALFSAVFGTPVTSSIFAIEMISVGNIYYVAFFPCLLSSLVAFWVASSFGVVPMAARMAAAVIPELSFATVGKVVLLGVAFAVVTVLFVSAVHRAEHWAKGIGNPYLRILLGAGILLLLTGGVWLATGEFTYNGAGTEGILSALIGNAEPWDFLLKILFTAVTLGFGFKGGKIVPGFFIGATLGCVLAVWMGLPPSFGVALGMVALFSGMTNCPLAALVLGIELFGGDGLLYFATVSAMLYLLAGYYSFYSGRETVYSKLQEEYIHQSVRREDSSHG